MPRAIRLPNRKPRVIILPTFRRFLGGGFNPLSLSQRQQVARYLGAKWGITVP